MADLHTFWNELDALPTEETPLTAAESDRLADAVLHFAQADTVHPGVDDVGNIINSGVVVHQDLLEVVV